MNEPAGSAYNYSNVIFAVLQDCEHRRRSFAFAEEEAGEKLMECAREQLRRVGAGYLDDGVGSPAYWRELEKEVLETVMPQYIPAAIEQNRRELRGYGVWRGGDLVARVLFAFTALIIAAFLLRVPVLPFWSKGFNFLLVLAAWFLPELLRMVSEHKHYRLLNRLVHEGEKYQRTRARYISAADLELDKSTSVEEGEPVTTNPEAVAAARASSVEKTGG